MSEILNHEYQSMAANAAILCRRNDAGRIRSRCLELQAASVLFRPNLSVDGDQWCAMYGNDLQSGVAGFGVSPSKAMDDFDRARCATL